MNLKPDEFFETMNLTSGDISEINKVDMQFQK
jgi:hypothetical protein